MTAYTLEKVTGLKVIGAVSRAMRDGERGARRLATFGYATGLTLLFAAVAVSIMFAQQGSHAIRLALAME
jgi:hypothetical protein